MTDSPDATQPTHDRTPEHPTDVPAGVEAMGAMNPNSLMHRMGIEIIEASAQRLVATMPVEGNTQPYGLLHGGASVVLAESVGSVLAVVSAGPGRTAVGVEINATHHRPATSGQVTGVATPLSVGRTMGTFDVVVSDEAGRRVCTCRFTAHLRDEPIRPR